MDIRNFARNMIEDEINQFNNLPKSYLEAMNWDLGDWPNIDEVVIDFSVTDVDQLEQIIYTNLNDGTIENKDPQTIFESSPVGDFLVNLVAEKINNIYSVE